MGYGGLGVSSADARLWVGVLFAAAALLVWLRPGITGGPLDMVPERWSVPIALLLLVVGVGVSLSGELG